MKLTALKINTLKMKQRLKRSQSTGMHLPNRKLKIQDIHIETPASRRNKCCQRDCIECPTGQKGRKFRSGTSNLARDLPQPHHHPTNAEFRIDTLGKPNDAYALHYVGRVVRVSRVKPDRKTPAPKRNVK